MNFQGNKVIKGFVAMTIVTGNLKVLCSREEDRLLDKKIPHVYHV